MSENIALSYFTSRKKCILYNSLFITEKFW